MPPSEPTQGVGPAPRQGAGGGCTCAKSVIATKLANAAIPFPPGERFDFTPVALTEVDGSFHCYTMQWT